MSWAFSSAARTGRALSQRTSTASIWLSFARRFPGCWELAAKDAGRAERIDAGALTAPPLSALPA